MAEASLPDVQDAQNECEYCNTTYHDIDSYAEHLASKDHIKKIMKKKYGKKYLEAKAKLEGKTLNGTAKDTNNQSKSTNDDSFVDSKATERKSEKKLIVDLPGDLDDSEGNEDECYSCDICVKVCTGYISYRLHMEGKNHKRAVNKMKLMKKYNIPEKKEISGDSSDLENLFPNTIRCEVCNIDVSGPEAYKQHLNGEKHKKALMSQAIIANKEGIDSLFGYEVTSKDDQAIPKRCDLCDKPFSGLKPYIQHMQSPTHLKKEQTMKEMSKIKDLCVSSEDSSKLSCTECGKTFSGPIPFQDHFATVHAKLKKKNDIIEALEKEYPEFKRNPDGILICKLCKYPLPGPESARDHFASAKHKRVKQKVEDYKKYLKMKEEAKLHDALSADRKDENSSEQDDSDDDFDIISKP